MAVFSLACKLYTALCGFCLLEKRQRLILPKELQTKSLRSNWIYHGSHVGGDSTTATHTHKQGFVVATPGACASGSCLGGQLHHALVAQVDTDGIIAAHTGKLGSVVATPGASASHLPIGGSASTFAAQVDEDGAASTSTSRVGSVVATPFACASDRQLAGLALFTLTTQVGEDYTTYVHRPGSVDATPSARSPGLHLAGREVQTSVAQVWDDGASSAPQYRSGYVDATPGACAPGSCRKGQIVQALAAQVGADYTSITFACRPGSVDATPGVDAGRPAQATPKRLTKYRAYHASRPPFAKASWFVDATPDTPERYAVTSPSRAVLCQPSLADRLRQGRGAVTTLDGSLQVMPPRWPTGCNVMPARSELASALKPYTGATPLEHELGTPQHNTAPLRAMHKPNLSQVCLAAKLHTALADGVDQAGQLPACLPAVPGQNLLQLLWAYTGSFTRLDAAQLPVCAGGLASPQLFVALHTAHVVVVFASAKMPICKTEGVQTPPEAPPGLGGAADRRLGQIQSRSGGALCQGRVKYRGSALLPSGPATLRGHGY